MMNNLSIPKANKRVIALDCGGAKLLGRMLCEDPGCHLLAIVIVNLTFGDAELNRDLLSMGGGGEVQLVDCLGYALLVSFDCFFFSRLRRWAVLPERSLPIRPSRSAPGPSNARRPTSSVRFAPLSLSLTAENKKSSRRSPPSSSPPSARSPCRRRRACPTPREDYFRSCSRSWKAS